MAANQMKKIAPGAAWQENHAEGWLPRPGALPPPGVGTMTLADWLHHQCAEVACPNGVTLTCSAPQNPLAGPAAVRMTVIWRGLIDRACEAFEGGRGGRIGVSLRAVGNGLELLVEHSASTIRDGDQPRVAGLELVRTLIASLGGRLEFPRVIAGMRMIVTIPGDFDACHQPSGDA